MVMSKMTSDPWGNPDCENLIVLITSNYLPPIVRSSDTPLSYKQCSDLQCIEQ